MSTKAAKLTGLVVLAALATEPAGCAMTAGDPGVNSLSTVRFGPHPATAAPAPAAEPAMASSAALAGTSMQIEQRVDSYLTGLGFRVEDSRDGAVRVVTATRMGDPAGLGDEAVCALEALRRPDISAANLTVRLEPSAQGVALDVTSSFTEVNTNLISGDLVRETCRSRGVLERRVRQAAQGG